MSLLLKSRIIIRQQYYNPTSWKIVIIKKINKVVSLLLKSRIIIRQQYYNPTSWKIVIIKK